HFGRMLETCINEFDMEDMQSKITQQIPMGSNISLSNVVILEPGKQLNCDDNVHAACEMYHDDLSLGNDDCLYVTCDQVIFGRLISYKEAHSDVQLILGQWHISKDM
ncbi:6392_t:CDS:1, partial [Diversispora eburnea]